MSVWWAGNELNPVLEWEETGKLTILNDEITEIKGHNYIYTLSVL